jgi:hypothetical protein
VSLALLDIFFGCAFLDSRKIGIPENGGNLGGGLLLLNDVLLFIVRLNCTHDQIPLTWNGRCNEQGKGRERSPS